MGLRNLQECFDFEEAMSGTIVDEANGVLKGVVLLTGNKTSLNRTNYTPKALAEAQKRYEGAKMFIDHRKDSAGNRSILDFGGTYKDARIEGDKLKADLHLVESKRSVIMPIAKMRPAGIGLSIKDRGHGVEREGVFFVEGFDPKASYSIDFVDGPSVNKDLFESKSHEEDEMDFKVLTAEMLSKERPELVESIQNAGKAAILKELEESKVNGKKSETMAAKLQALIAADFPKDISESVKKMILAEDISVETANGIITGQKALIESLTKKKGDGKPVITGMGHRVSGTVEESAKNELSDDEIADSFKK